MYVAQRPWRPGRRAVYQCSLLLPAAYTVSVRMLLLLLGGRGASHATVWPARGLFWAPPPHVGGRGRPMPDRGAPHPRPAAAR
eukprot:COSAG01_NODE_5913_length_3957_cov_228.332037_2_plen_83_part_00